MSKKLGLALLIAIALLAAALPAAAQTPPPQTVELEADDGLVLVGAFYALPETDSEAGEPAVLLMHHGGAQKESWIDVIPVLFEAGYHVLTIDIRGHGETGGAMTPADAIADAHLWLAWLREQPGVDPDRVSIVGASLGADIGLPVMADDERLVTLVAISSLTGLEGLDTAGAVQKIGRRPLYFIAGLGVPDEAEAVRTLFGLATGDVQARLYDSRACCTFLFMMERDLAPSVIAWLDRYNR